MTNRVTITIHMDLPDGVIPDVQYATVAVPPAVIVADEPLPPEQHYDRDEQTPFPPFPSQASSPPFCKVHNAAMKPSTKKGIAWYCSGKVGDAWCTEKVAA